MTLSRQRRLKVELHFTYESRGTLKSSTSVITVKTITKLNLKHSDKFEMEFQKKKIADVVNLVTAKQNLIISLGCFAEDGKEMRKKSAIGVAI